MVDSTADYIPAPPGTAQNNRVSPDFRHFARLLLFACLVYALFAVFSVSTFFVPGLEMLPSYRISALATIFTLFLLIFYFEVNILSHARDLADRRRVATCRRLRRMLLAITALLSMVYLLTMFSFSFPRLAVIASLRALAPGAFLVAILGILRAKAVAEKERLAANLTYENFGQDALIRRFRFSLAILFLVPAGILSTYFHQRLPANLDIRLLLVSLAGAALIGFWSVYKDINLLVAIIDKVKSLAKGRYREKISAAATPEIRELVDSFNLIISDLQGKMAELEDAKLRIKSMVGRIGQAITSTNSVDELLNLVLEISADALKADEGYLYTFDPLKKMVKWQVFAKVEKDSQAVVKIQQRLQALVKTSGSVLEKHFMAVPLSQKGKTVGALGIKRDAGSSSFHNEDRELLQNIANQAALAVEVSQLQAGAERVYFEIISTLAMAIEAKDPYTRGHSQITARLAAAIAERLGAGPEEIQEIRDVALLHDIGKVGIPDVILNKPGPLSEPEFDIIKKHPLMGERILAPINSLKSLLPGVRNHHERPDGKGYPDGLKEPMINFTASVVHMADAVEAMFSGRPYRAALSLEEVKETVRRDIGSNFSRKPAEALLELIESEGEEFLK